MAWEQGYHHAVDLLSFHDESNVFSVWEYGGVDLLGKFYKVVYKRPTMFMGYRIREQKNIKSTTKPLMTILDITEP